MRLKIRTRLTVAFGALVFGAGALVIALLYLFMRFVPNYQLGEISLHPENGWESVTVEGNPFVFTDASQILDTLLWVSILILLLMTALASFGGWIVAGRMLRPLQRIGDAAQRAGQGRLDHRIRLDGPQDELRDLADTFDRTLDRLEQAFTAHERFAANAAHELRTPLTATKTVIDIAEAFPEAQDPWEVLRLVARNNDRSIETVQALLELTTIDASRIETERVDLAGVAADVIEKADVVDAQVSLARAVLDAEPVLLRLLVENLVRNAVLHNDERGRVDIETGSAGEGSWLRVSNTGPVVAEADVHKLTEPLYRASRTGSGHGLGLAIVASVVGLHQGALTIRPRFDGGLDVTVTFPSLS